MRLRLIATLFTDSTPLPDKEINFYYSYDGESWEFISTSSTDTEGKAYAEFSTYKKTYFKAVFPGDDVYDAAEAEAVFTPPISEQLKPLIQSIMQLLPPLLQVMLTINLILGAFRGMARVIEWRREQSR